LTNFRDNRDNTRVLYMHRKSGNHIKMERKDVVDKGAFEPLIHTAVVHPLFQSDREKEVRR